jgi:Na+/H+ antiporter NhaD/arsenite permease-like protein
MHPIRHETASRYVRKLNYRIAAAGPAASSLPLSPAVIEAVRAFRLDNVYILTAVSAALSNLISNVPAVLALKPFVTGLSVQFGARRCYIANLAGCV